MAAPRYRFCLSGERISPTLSKRSNFLVLIFALAALVSASLLFLIQPLFAKMALPLLGGAPNVWIICMLFFQAILLAGYTYAYLSLRWLSISRQMTLHALMVLAPLAVLPIGISASTAPLGDADPTLWLLTLLTVTVGLPFFAVSASATCFKSPRQDPPPAGSPSGPTVRCTFGPTATPTSGAYSGGKKTVPGVFLGMGPAKPA